MENNFSWIGLGNVLSNTTSSMAAIRSVYAAKGPVLLLSVSFPSPAFQVVEILGCVPVSDRRSDPCSYPVEIWIYTASISVSSGSTIFTALTIGICDCGQ